MGPADQFNHCLGGFTATAHSNRGHAPATHKQHRIYAAALIITQAEVCPLAQSTLYALALWKLSDRHRHSIIAIFSRRNIPGTVNKSTWNYVLAKTIAGNLAFRVNESCGTHTRWRHESHDVTAGAAEVAEFYAV